MSENTKEVIKELSNIVKKLEKEKDWVQAAAVWEKIENLCKEIVWTPAQNQAHTQKAECLKKIEAEKAKLEKEQKVKVEKETKSKEKKEDRKEKVDEKETLSEEPKEDKTKPQEVKKDKPKREKEDDEKKKSETDNDVEIKMKAWKLEQERKEKEKKKPASSARTVDQILKERNLIEANPLKKIGESKSQKSPEETAQIQNEIVTKEQQASTFMMNRQWTEANALWHEIEKSAQQIGAIKTIVTAQKNQKTCTDNWYAEQTGKKK